MWVSKGSRLVLLGIISVASTLWETHGNIQKLENYEECVTKLER